MVSRASPSLPFQLLATVVAGLSLFAAESLVSRIVVGVAPRFQMMWSTPSAVRARPSCTPGWVGPLMRAHGVAWAWAVGASRAAAAAAVAIARCMWRLLQVGCGDGEWVAASWRS